MAKKAGGAFFALMLLVVFGTFVSRQDARAEGKYCDLALVLAIDASSSVDEEEYDLQMKGMASALLDKEVQEAILSLGGMYLTAFEWNGRNNQKMIFGWVYLDSSDDIYHLASNLTTHDRNTAAQPTALGYALWFGQTLIEKTPAPCARYVIDVSGDGPNNEGVKPSSVYRMFDFSNIIVNGLVIKDDYKSPENFYRDPEGYYRENVLHGGGAFLMLANGFQDFARAMKEKLLKEIVPGPIGHLDTQD